MKLLKTSIAIASVTLFVAACQKAETSNNASENTVVTQNTTSTENLATVNATNQNVVSENAAGNGVAVSERTTTRTAHKGVKDDSGPRH